MSAYRNVQIIHKDSLKDIAWRELGDVTQWISLIDINGLVYPYIGKHGDAREDRVLYPGDTILVPDDTGDPSGLSVDDIYGTDLDLSKGVLTSEAGDLKLITGTRNMTQALDHVIRTNLGELRYHSLYGCGIYSLLGTKNKLQSAVLAKSYVDRALTSDRRVISTSGTVVEITGDALKAESVALCIDRKTVGVTI